MKLFDTMPYLENESVILKEMTRADAPALHEIASDPRVYVYLPTFLYEQKYKDPYQVIDRMREECFLPKESIMLGVYSVKDPASMTGIAEIYAYDEMKNKASIGLRLMHKYWHKGLALPAALLMRKYLEEDMRIRTITLHVMRHNMVSPKIAIKAGFVNMYSGLWEDWGREGPVLIDKYVYRNLNNPKGNV